MEIERTVFVHYDVQNIQFSFLFLMSVKSNFNSDIISLFCENYPLCKLQLQKLVKEKLYQHTTSTMCYNLEAHYVRSLGQLVNNRIYNIAKHGTIAKS